jgi:hypothetical protein
MHALPTQGPLQRPQADEKYGRGGHMMKWREQLNGDCPKRDAPQLHDRCV